MKKVIILLLVFSMLLAGCEIIPGNANKGQVQDTTTQDNAENQQSENDKSNQQDKNTQNTDTKSGIENHKTPDKVEIFDDASVEALIQLSQDFLDSAFSGSIDDMLNYCDDTLGGKIEANPKYYIGTKPDYTISKIDTSIKLTGNSRYLLQSVVSAVSKRDKKKYDFKYTMAVEKVKEDYYITEFKKYIN